MVTYVKVVINL